VEAHGGYLCRLEAFNEATIVGMAGVALLEDGLDPFDTSLQVSGFAGGKVLRLAYDTPRVYGRKGARWYATHHALAVRLSKAASDTVHAYVHDPGELEQVVTYEDGRRTGGEVLRYGEVEVFFEEELSVRWFERLQRTWPLGHLAKAFGLRRKELLKLPRCESLLLDLTPPKVEERAVLGAPPLGRWACPL
jgi:hypothetical protein